MRILVVWKYIILIVHALTLQAISCSKNSTGVSCFLIVNNSHSEIGTIETDTFVPQPPIVFGQAILSDRGKVSVP